MKTSLLPLAAILPLALLAGCGDKASEDDDRSASGEVLEGTISDAMLPVDQLQSEPPRLQDVEETGSPGTGESGGESAEPAGEGEAAAEEPEAPAEPETFEEAFEEN